MKRKRRNNARTGSLTTHARTGWVLAVVVLALLAACNRNGKESHSHAVSEPTARGEIAYACPMHPEIVRNAPGPCPVCGMDLVRRVGGNAPAGDTTVPINASVAELAYPTNAQVLSGVKLIRPQRQEVPVTIPASGYVAYDRRRFRSIPARFGGRIERLYVKYRFQPVGKGQPLFDIYSPEVLTEQQNLLFLLNNDAGAGELIAASRRKLRLLGLSESQIRAVAAGGRAEATVRVFSPADGYVIENETMAAAPASGGGGMEGAASAGAVPVPAQTTLPSVREGTYVAKGQSVFSVVNVERVWAVLKVYAPEVASVRKGQPVRITVENVQNADLEARVDFVEPVYERGSTTLSVRVYLPNPDGRLKIGQLLTARIEAGSRAGWWVPRTAVVDLGTQRVAFVKRGNLLRAVTVATGARSEDRVEIAGGLSGQDEIAENAQFLMDSESFIQATNREK